MQEPQPCGYPLRLSVQAAPFPIESCYMQFVFMVNSCCYMFSKGSSLKPKKKLPLFSSYDDDHKKKKQSKQYEAFIPTVL